MLGEKKSKKRIALLTLLMMLITTFVPSVSWADEVQTEEYEYYYKGYELVDRNNYKASYSEGSSLIAVFKLSKNKTGPTEYAYCSDLVTSTEEQKDVWYSRTDIEKSGYFSESNARKIRNIVVHSYPFISIDQITKDINAWIPTYNAKNNPDISLTNNRALNEKTLKTATQVAIWRHSNPGKNVNTHAIPSADQNNVDVVLKYLMDLPELAADKDEIVVGAADVTANIDTVLQSGVKKHKLTGTFHFYDKTSEEASSGERQIATPDPSNITLTLKVGNKTVSGNLKAMMVPGNDMGISVSLKEDSSYSFEIDNIDDSHFTDKSKTADVTVSFSGQQQMPAGAYFYKTENRDYSQNFVGYAAPWVKPIDVSAETTVALAPTVILDAKKLMDGKKPGNANIFEFELKDESGKTIQTKANNAAGNIVFDEILLSKANATYKYTISEKIPGTNEVRQDVVYDNAVYEATVNVAFNEIAKGYVTTTSYKKVADAGNSTVSNITFANKTRSAAALQLTANKLLNNEAPGEGNVFNFTLKNSEGETIGMAANDAEGQIHFTPLAFDEVGTYTYYINEELGTDAIVYDSTVHSVEVQVTAPANSESFVAKVTKIDGKEYTGASSQLPITFSNASMGAAQIKLQAVKTVDGNAPGANNIFTFHLKTKAGVLVQEVKSDANGNVVFDFPSAAAVGQFEYTVSEVNEGRHDVIYDETVYDITVDVTRNTEGTALVATPSITKAGEAVTTMVFDNKTRGAAELQLSANKTLDGNAPGSENVFQFQLKKQDAAAGEVLVSTAQNNAQGKITFDKITFNAPGTYTYTISEAKGLGQFKYDGTVHTVEIDVTAPEGVDNYQAKVVKVDGQEYNGTSDLPIEFKNVTIAPATLALTANKTIDGEAPGKGNTFTFQLKDKDGKVVKEAKNAADGKISFSELTFTEPGTYEYTISEVTEVGQHFIYDTTVHNVTVNVGLNSDGTAYTASVVGPAEVKFNNVTRAPAKVQLAAVKTLEGGTLTDGQFSFLIESADGKYKETKTNAADGKINFSELTFTEAGTYEYTISEVAGNGNIKYDDSNYNIRIVVTAPEDNKSAYEADVYVNGYAYAGKDAAQITFNNVVIQPAKIALTASKLLDDKKPAAEQFSFQLKDEEGKVLQTVSNKADGSITFAPIDYDIPEDGTAQYKYTISEVTETGKAILYDESVYDVTVDIELNEDGTAYVATPTITKNGEVAEPVFNNTTRGPVVLKLTANKTLDGNVPGDSQFTFELKSADGKYKETKTNAADGKISFDELTFDKEGTYKYTVSETAGTDAIKYDETVYDVEIKVYAPKDNSSKDLAAEIYVDGIKYDKAQDLPLTFKNITIKAAKIQLKASKLLDGKTPEEGQFSFQLKDEAGNVLQTVSNKADGSIVFDPIDYGKSADTYKYTISEVDGGKDSIMYDETVYDVTVDVALDEQGTAYTATTKTNNIVFNNATIKPATLVLTAEKLLGGEAPAEEYEGKFAFQLRDENYEVVSEAINGKDGKVIFEKMTFNKAGTYYYTMSEVPGNVKNVIYDGTTYIVKVDVELKYGVQPLSLDAEPQGPCYVATPTIMNSAAMIDEDGSDEIITAKFHNSFVQPAKGQFVALRATKPGVASPDKETDTFVLKDEDGNELQKKYNDEDGNVEFDEIEFPKEEGTYKYTIVKNPWDEKNVVYDESTYTAIVKVTYIEEKESYEAEVKYFEGDINPNNTSDKEAKDIPSFEDIRIAPATLQLEASKTLDGKAPAADQFTFQLKDKAGEVIQTTTNNAEGKILFDEISYDAEGEYTYTISEVKGTDEGIVYDETVYTIRVKVETNKELKQYVTKIDCSADEILFENETVKPAEVPLDVSTDTGDHSCMILWAMMLMTSLMIMILIFAIGRRRIQQQA